MRLPAHPGECIDRSRTVRFRFGKKSVEGFAGETLGAALFASGQRVFSRSFKYHRPRGLMCCSGHCANCMMAVDGVPNVRVCVEPIREGAQVEPQNVLGSLEHDLMAVTDKIGGPFTPVGFYYRTMLRPRRAWPLYEKFLRHAAGLGKVGGAADGHYETEHRHARVLVVGGGPAGREAALQAAAEGPGVVLVDERGTTDLAGVEVLAPARALGIWEGGLVPIDAGDTLYRYRAEKIIVATGTLEQPLIFPGNDLVGVVLPGAVHRMVEDWSLKPGERAAVISADEHGLAVVPVLERAGVAIAQTIDLRRTAAKEIRASGRKGQLRNVEIDGQSIDCDLLVMSGGRQPAYSLLAQTGARVEYDGERGIFVPVDLPPGVEAVGSVNGASAVAVAARSEASYASSQKGKCFVCFCEDVTDKDLDRAIREGFDSIELAKRYTTLTMGPCQGKLCHLPSIRLYAKKTSTDEAAIGTTTARPPWTPVELGLLAGRHHEPLQRTALHFRHEEAGADMIWAGKWKRPHSYGDPAAEVRAVHDSLGVIDVSTLGKLIVEGPDAAEFLERLYPNRFADLKIGRIRYGVLTTDGGRIMDDGTVARLHDDLFYVTTTSTGSEGVLEWFEWWNAVWGYDVEIVNVTGALAAINLAGPDARSALAPLTDADVSNEALGYLDAREIAVAGVPCLALRIGFVGELGYELHCASPAAQHLWDVLLGQGARPFGLEPQRVLRLEKQHIIVGQDTDGESNLLSANMPWIVKLDKDDFVGRWATELVPERGLSEKLVGFTVHGGALPKEGAQVVVDGLPAGRVTSARLSERVGTVVGLAWVPASLAEEGSQIAIRVDGTLETASVALAPFYDPDGSKLRS
jgi:sarcosine oxidase, subunit alpha